MTLQDFFEEYPKGAVAFSGGVDSSYLVWAASRYGRDWKAYYVKSQFQPDFELEDAVKVARQCGMTMEVIELSVLEEEKVISNPADRCYHCKRIIFSAVIDRALADDIHVVVDGTNASDDPGDRPGMRALRELEVRSPLRECGLTKDDVRRLSRKAGLFTADKPAYACLATRIPVGMAINEGILGKIESGENYLFSLGFKDFRLRLQRDGGALLQLRPEDFSRLPGLREEILSVLSPHFSYIHTDLFCR